MVKYLLYIQILRKVCYKNKVTQLSSHLIFIYGSMDIIEH